ncbi:hypothetical protein HPP92_008389 [Vanilla planifolia]|uniref:SPX domain-containing protein n=1 Tax=Vanilla planifolia TaxID=51239 RepID=A0A835R2K4_VANPL|nr:hypothetical protein HPP92_008389 [Vanilla planifolia]
MVDSQIVPADLVVIRQLLGLIYCGFSAGEGLLGTFSGSLCSSSSLLYFIKDSTVTIKMVNFGKKLMVDQIPEWKRYYINYKLMKKKVRQYAEQIKNEGKDRGHVLKEFSRMLDDQIEKMVLFLLEQQGVLASRIEKLGEQRANLAEMPDISKISELREAYRVVALDLVKLLKFVDLNATGIRKILKKFDKRFGYRFTDYYVTSRQITPILNCSKSLNMWD